MSDNQNKITNFFLKPKVVARKSYDLAATKQSPTKPDLDNSGYSSDTTEIYDYEEELSKHIQYLGGFNDSPNSSSQESSTKSVSRRGNRKQLKEDSQNVRKIFSPRNSARKSRTNDSSRNSTKNIEPSETKRRNTRNFSKNENGNSLVEIQPVANEVPLLSETDLKNKKSSKVPFSVQLPVQPVKKVTSLPFTPPIVYGKLWTETHQPSSGEDFLGEKHVFDSAKCWLESWKTKFNSKDFQLDNSDVLEPEHKCLYLFGPSGVGKTSMVFTLAKQCGYKVLEYNAASQKLTSALLQKDLLEAAQSHCIGAGKISSFFKPKVNTPNTSSNAQISNSLILFDDIDAILYEGLELWRTIRQIIYKAKKPIVFTARFGLGFLTSEGNLFRKFELKSLTLGRILNKVEQIVRTELNTNDGSIEQTALVRRLTVSSGDLRQSINQTQFWFTKQALNDESIDHSSTENIDEYRRLLDLVSLEDCLDRFHHERLLAIEDHLEDYNKHTYHSLSSFLFDEDHSLHSQQAVLLRLFHERHSHVSNCDRYSYDVHHFYA